MPLIYRDPGISFGRFRVLPRTDGKWIVYDPDLPFAYRTAWLGNTIEDAAKACKRLHEKSLTEVKP